MSQCIERPSPNGVAMLLLIAGAALAVNAHAAPSSAQRAPSSTQIRAGERVKIPLRDAIESAEQQTHGQAVDARLEIRNGRPQYFVATFGDGRLWKGYVDAQTGRVIGNGVTVAETHLGQADKARVAELRRAKISLAGAAGIVEELQDGKAIQADLAASNGKPMYQTEFISNGKLDRSTVNPESGALLTQRTSESSMLGG
jgi:uncharacterized membrane protein YkoI